MHVTIRADGGPEIGYGHLVRTGALADELLNSGHHVTYATTTPDQVEDVCPSGVRTTELPSKRDVAPFVNTLDEDVDIAVIDSYLTDCDYQRVVRDEIPLVLVSDDARDAVCADVVVNGNLYASGLDYEVVGEEPTWCLGPEFALLREEISRLAEQAPPRRDPPERAIVTMGGSDVENTTPDAVKAFDGTGLLLDIVVGPGFRNEANIRDLANRIVADTRVVRNPSNLPELMYEADFAVGACGSTTYEMLALGTPLVCCPVVDNQESIATALDRQNAAIVVRGDDKQHGLQQAVSRYLTNGGIRRKHRERGRALVDGQGTMRVYSELLSVVDQNTGL